MSHFQNVLKYLLIILVIAGFYYQQDIGLADNGDFSRVMTRFTSGPINNQLNQINLPNDNSTRFFTYWLPYWKFELTNQSKMNSTAILLWVPGIFINYLFISPTILYLANISFLQKVLLCLCVILIIRLIEDNTDNKIYKMVLLLSVGLPFCLMLISTNYVAYLNSFYFEGASITYLLGFLLLITTPINKPLLKLSIGSVLLLLLTSVKTSYIYWPFLAIPFLFFSCGIQKKVKLLNLIILYVSISMIITGISFFITYQPKSLNKINSFHSLYYGVLTLSKHPSQRLRDIGLSGSTDCIGIPAFWKAGTDCLIKYENQMSFINTLRVIFREPILILRIGNYTSKNMQVISLKNLGKHSIYNPLPENKDFSPPINIWGIIKERYFPKGLWLWLALIIFTIVFILIIFKRHNPNIALVGLLVTITTAADMYIAFLGDGKQELVKHLFLANVLFDIAIIIFLGYLSIACVKIITLIIQRFKNAHN